MMRSNSMVMNNKEKTKLRERQRRSITTKIFHGLRKHGGYNLSPRSDINHVLRQLAMEAGWVVEPDGTTYRSPAVATSNSKDSYVCPACGGAGKRSSTSTPSSNFLAAGGGEFCSTMAPNSPRRSAVSDSMMLIGGGNAVAPYGGGLHQTFAVTGQNISTNKAVAAYHDHDHDHYLMETAKASNQNTPVGSP